MVALLDAVFWYRIDQYDRSFNIWKDVDFNHKVRREERRGERRREKERGERRGVGSGERGEGRGI